MPKIALGYASMFRLYLNNKCLSLISIDSFFNNSYITNLTLEIDVPMHLHLNLLLKSMRNLDMQ